MVIRAVNKPLVNQCGTSGNVKLFSRYSLITAILWDQPDAAKPCTCSAAGHTADAKALQLWPADVQARMLNLSSRTLMAKPCPAPCWTQGLLICVYSVMA